MSKNNNFSNSCQSVHGIYSGVTKDGVVMSGALRCKKWSCPVCGPRKVSQLKMRLHNGPLAAEGHGRHGLKFCTLTFGGIEKRSEYIVYKPDGSMVTWEYYDAIKSKKITAPVYNLLEMYEEMMDGFNRLLTALRKHYGKFKYFRICEPHSDGVPHLHILFAGRVIAPRSFLHTIEKLWKKYGFGFVKLNTLKDKNGRPIKQFNDAKHAINYLLKYITKEIKTAGKFKRVFSCSQGSLLKVVKMEWEDIVIVEGHFDDHDTIVENVLKDHEKAEFKSTKCIFDGNDFHLEQPDIVRHIMNRHLYQLTLNGSIKDDCNTERNFNGCEAKTA